MDTKNIKYFYLNISLEISSGLAFTGRRLGGRNALGETDQLRGKRRTRGSEHFVGSAQAGARNSALFKVKKAKIYIFLFFLRIFLYTFV